MRMLVSLVAVVSLAACSKKPHRSEPSGPAPSSQAAPAPSSQAAPSGIGESQPVGGKAPAAPPGLTAQDQANDPADRLLAAKVRAAIVADPTLTVTDQNVKVIVAGGVVTLRGSVANVVERTKVEAAARRATGVGELDDQLEIEK